VVLRAFHLRNGSGGDGQFKGGDGVVREVCFRCKSKGIRKTQTSPTGLNRSKADMASYVRCVLGVEAKG
jgi:N-methylhydantoinase B/oxoprolinase/acetone carboxylase alpha subunit